ncbi:TIGR03943 family putative permease subunit [Desertibacillus haloalkaliphilus]|uniref:TIGR03943 family putative permease subunit n=1 Tax=Desertibacillus haloalkaliphilus TaxID=1328930 RepID=UPI001C267C7C|nr:TIGR03943 family protein [Desertibacillus haloalkaliphilus]MBU8905340.1 TIGR03943 family protein [Desertibacillus haloalkaliphilus]
MCIHGYKRGGVNILRIHLRQLIKAFVLLLFAVFIFILHESGEIGRFINPDYLYFSQIASVLFLFLFFIQVPRIFTTTEHDHSQCGPWGCTHDDDNGGSFSLQTFISYGIIILPLVTGFLLPYKDFGAAEAQKRGVSYSTYHDHGDLEDHELFPQEKDILEIINEPALYFDNTNFADYLTSITTYPEGFIGKSIELDGFILEDDFHVNSKRTVITRFLVTHCVADAHAAGIVIEDGSSLGIKENSWIRVKGKLDVQKEGEWLIPVIKVDSWKEIDLPLDPYIYP